MKFPQYISFTITNACNLRCRMCGQWSEKGYMYNKSNNLVSLLELTDWKHLLDEVATHDIKSILIRGGEPFLFPKIMDLLKYINKKGIKISIDTNGTLLNKYAAELIEMGNIHLTISLDGPQEIHDKVRGVPGCFKKIKNNVTLLNELEKHSDQKISKSICCTISKYSYKGLAEMPDIARSMAISTISIVPYYYFSLNTGKKYEEELYTNFNCPAFSWRGFQHEYSGIDFKIFREKYRKYLKNLQDIYNFPYMKLSEDDYSVWFHDTSTPVGSSTCMNIEKLIDIQPTGETNFCVDFPDYSLGNVKNSSIKEIWNSNRASEFRKYRQEKPLAICYRCGAKYISEIKV